MPGQSPIQHRNMAPMFYTAWAPLSMWVAGFFVLISFHMFQADLVNIIKTDLRNKILNTQHSFLPHHVDVKFLFWGEVSMLDHVRC